MAIDILRFLLLGLGSTAIITLMASGVVVIFRGSGVINFAQGSFAAAAGYTYYELKVHDYPTVVAALAAVLLAAVLGFLTQVLVMWPMRRSSPLARIVATLALVVIVTEAIDTLFGSNPEVVDGFLPDRTVSLGSIRIPENRIWLLGIAIVVTVVLWVSYRRSRFGLATTAGAEDQDAISALGWSPGSIACVNWTIGAALGGLAGVLYVPLNGVSQVGLALAIVPALSAALVGGFSSFPLTFVGALIIGISQSEIARFVSTPGWSVIAPVAVIVVILVLRGESLPERSFLADRLPRVGNGRFSPLGALLYIVVVVLLANRANYEWSRALIVTALGAIIGLSLVVVTGYAGQISLAQYALSGVGGLIATRFATLAGVPFVWAVLLGAALTVPVGVILSIPAFRARGLNLAVITLGFAAVIDGAVLTNVNWTGSLSSQPLDTPTFAGISLDATIYPNRYATVCLVVLGIMAAYVSYLRRSCTGRRLLAVRENERAAAAMGISVVGAKVFAFAVAAGMAGLAGGLAAFQFPNVDFSSFAPVLDISFVMLVVIGGLGYISGAINTGVLVAAGVGETIIVQWFDVGSVWQLALATFLLVQLVFTPDGLAHHQVELMAGLRRRLARLRPRREHPAVPKAGPAAVSQPAKVSPQTLELRGVIVEFGGNRAIDGLSLTVSPGEVVGLIGPNGAGKTTLIDVATGFVKPKAGQVLLNGESIEKLSARGRAQRGLSRSWQSQELFASMTVEENLRAAAEMSEPWSLRRLLGRKTPMPATAMASIDQFELHDVLDRYPEGLPYAVRRLVGIGRAVAGAPSVLLLDEPTAGMDQVSTRELGDLIRKLAREWGMGILLIEHDVSLVMRTCDRIVAMAYGKQIASGLPQEVRMNPAVIDAYLGASADEPEPDDDRAASALAGDSSTAAVGVVA